MRFAKDGTQTFELILAGGLNPLAAVEQSGVSAVNMAMAEMYDFAALETYAQLAERFGVRPPQPML